jgi:uncharacterized membrane protein
MTTISTRALISRLLALVCLAAHHRLQPRKSSPKVTILKTALGAALVLAAGASPQATPLAGDGIHNGQGVNLPRDQFDWTPADPTSTCSISSMFRPRSTAGWWCGAASTGRSDPIRLRLHTCPCCATGGACQCGSFRRQN